MSRLSALSRCSVVAGTLALTLLNSGFNSVTPTAPNSLPFVQLHSGNQSGFTRNSELVIRDADEFTRRWRGVQQGTPDAALPEVNFEKSTVVLVGTGIRNTDGHSVRVDSVTAEAKDGATVHYTVTSPGKGCMSLQVLTSPIDVISFARVAGEVKFKKRGVSGGC